MIYEYNIDNLPIHIKPCKECKKLPSFYSEVFYFPLSEKRTISIICRSGCAELSILDNKYDPKNTEKLITEWNKHNGVEDFLIDFIHKTPFTITAPEK